MEDGSASLFRPDYFRPSQWRDQHRGENGDDAPIKRLMLAMLEDALRDATGARSSVKVRRWNALRSPRAIARAGARRSQRARALRRDALKWVFDTDAEGVFSFVSVCDTLGIDAERLRGRVAGRDRLTSAGVHQLGSLSGGNKSFS